MSTLQENLMSHPLVQSIGWALVHFLWQATLIAVVAFVLLAIMQRANARSRYRVAGIGLCVMVIVPIATAAWILSQSEVPRSDIASTARIADLSPENEKLNSGSDTLIVPSMDRPDSTSPTIDADFIVDGDAKQPTAKKTESGITLSGIRSVMSNWLPVCVVAWLLGVLFLGFRLLLGLGRVQRWRRSGQPVLDRRLNQALKRLSSQLAIAKPPRLLESAIISVPAVIGWVRPVILIPTSMVSGLTTSELEAILAHELAHIRRHDYLFNLLQNVAETLLFYHPAVWWISNRIRVEREFCCDDMAIELCGNRTGFAKALARMESIRCGNRLAVAATGGSLVSRIRRIVSGQPSCTGSWWPAGAAALLAMSLLLGGIWVSQASATSTGNEAGEETTVTQTDRPGDVAEANLSFENENGAKKEGDKEDDEEEYAVRKDEVKKTDSKTGFEKPVFVDIQLQTNRNSNTKNATVDMMYSNVMMYTFIPARIAEQLNAIELGEISFGDVPPPRPGAFQAAQILIQDEKQGGDQPKELDEPKEKTFTVNQLTEPITEGKIVPYGNEPVWTSGHLGFYGMNQTKQRVFKVVRIDRVDLGIGLPFGPINVLVSDNENSDFGVMGRDWSQQVKGSKGERLWHYATGSFRLLAPKPKKKAEIKPAQSDVQPNQNQPANGKMTVESSGQESIDPRAARPYDDVIASHQYNSKRRVSKEWIPLKNGRVPVDEGVTHDGITVYISLMQDVAAVDQNKEVVWSLDWNKRTPLWQAVSILNLEIHGEKQPIVELFAANTRTGELTYQYHVLATGEMVNVVEALFDESPDGNSDKQPELRNQDEGDSKTSASIPQVKVLEKKGEQITKVALEALAKGRSAAELIKHFSILFDRQGSPKQIGSVTNMESIVTAHPRYLLNNWMDADEASFSLPEGSGTYAEISGERIELKELEDSLQITVTHGKVELLDSEGVVRARATADGGAEQLVIACSISLDEVGMILKTQRLVADPEFLQPPVQVQMNVEAQAAADEKDPPHGAVRYEIFPEDKDSERPVRMKMKWRYDMVKLAEEAEEESGKSWHELLYGETEPQVATKSKQDSRPNTPWIAKGTVTDRNGEPMEGVSVVAHCGIGTLRRTGAATTGKDGRYELRFGPGGFGGPKLVQAATISVHLSGHTEANLHRQGDCVAAMEKPDGEIGWGGKTLEQLFLPNQPKEINFVMVPATSLRGVVLKNGKPQKNIRVSLTGEQMPPSSSVVGNTRTNDQGEFEIADIPAGFAYQVMVEPAKAESPWLAWASAPIVFGVGANGGIQVACDDEGEKVTFHTQKFQLELQGDGVNWKQALKQGAERRLEFQLEGGSIDDGKIRSRVAAIELR